LKYQTRHVTHHDDCGCLTLRYKVAINALFAIQKHIEIVTKTPKLSTVYDIASRAIDAINKSREAVDVQ
jgi:hypothetical protein